LRTSVHCVPYVYQSTLNEVCFITFTSLSQSC